MKKNSNKLGIKLVFYRTLYSQSAASVTMASIAAYLRKYDYNVELCLLRRNLFQRSELDTCKKLFKDCNKYNIIIAKPNFKDYSELFPLLERIKRTGLFKRIFLCGPFAGLNAEDIMDKLGWVDGIILGQPEETVYELINSFSKDFNKWDFSCPGGIWRDTKDNSIKKAEKRKIKLGLDDLPFPARDIEKEEQVSYVNLEASRGCNFICSYCHVPLHQKLCEVEKRIIRSPKKVVDEIERLNKHLSKTLFIFNDSHFWSCKKDDNRILEFCNELKKRKLNVKLYIYLRCNPFPDERIIKALAEAGLVRVFLGVENASESSLKIYRKNIDLKEFPQIKKLLDKYSINMHIGYIVFQPYSTLEDIKINIDYLYRINKLCRIGVVTEAVRVIPGSKLYIQLMNDGLLDKNLGFDKLTYGYKYKNLEVGELFHGIKKIFFDTLKELGYCVEYHFVSGELLKTLVKRVKSGNIHKLQKDFNDFDKACDECKKLMYSYFKNAIKIAKEGGKADAIADEKINAKFIKQYKGAAFDLQVAWGKMVESTRLALGDKIIDEVFKGVE